MLQDTMLMLSAVMSSQFCACIWQFFIAPLELWAILLARGSNDVEWDQIQTKIHLYMHISSYIDAKYKNTYNQMDYDTCIYFQLVYRFIGVYIWLHIAIYAYICRIYALKRCARPLPNAFTPRKLVYTIPS